ncbi:YdeI/OmpD-associated family protein [Actinomadura sediminis]|uniref:YdeI family protein n=1 Tax=Actinomadura sediminis TaxID=1038904 RepID=A0ABW3EMZ3_9ACTN
MTEPILEFDRADQWDAWLDEHHGTATGAWLKIAKKNSGATSITLSEALDGALCHGWIDGRRQSLDERHYLQRYSPRSKRSTWSKVNVAKAEALIEAGRMRPPGYAAIDAAKADGRWDAAYEAQRNATVPPDLASALEGSARAKAAFDALGRTDRYLLILGLLKARTPEGRAARLRRTIERLEDDPR